jgi:hypothetical protein
MAHPRAVDGRDGLQQWRLAANILNKQPWTNDIKMDLLEIGLIVVDWIGLA